jgi:dihydroorotase-like cyclic amidohydrolase
LPEARVRRNAVTCCVERLQQVIISKGRTFFDRDGGTGMKMNPPLRKAAKELKVIQDKTDHARGIASLIMPLIAQSLGLI